MRFTDTPEGAHLKGKRFNHRALQGETLIAYREWVRKRHRENHKDTSLKNKTSLHGVLSAKKANPQDEDIDLWVFDNYVRQAGACRKPWRGYVNLGNGGFWKGKRHAA